MTRLLNMKDEVRVRLMLLDNMRGYMSNVGHTIKLSNGQEAVVKVDFASDMNVKLRPDDVCAVCIACFRKGESSPMFHNNIDVRLTLPKPDLGKVDKRFSIVFDSDFGSLSVRPLTLKTIEEWPRIVAEYAKTFCERFLHTVPTMCSNKPSEVTVKSGKRKPAQKKSATASDVIEVFDSLRTELAEYIGAKCRDLAAPEGEKVELVSGLASHFGITTTSPGGGIPLVVTATKSLRIYDEDATILIDVYLERPKNGIRKAPRVIVRHDNNLVEPFMLLLSVNEKDIWGNAIKRFAEQVCEGVINNACLKRKDEARPALKMEVGTVHKLMGDAMQSIIASLPETKSGSQKVMLGIRRHHGMIELFCEFVSAPVRPLLGPVWKILFERKLTLKQAVHTPRPKPRSSYIQVSIEGQREPFWIAKESTMDKWPDHAEQFAKDVVEAFLEACGVEGRKLVSPPKPAPPPSLLQEANRLGFSIVRESAPAQAPYPERVTLTLWPSRWHLATGTGTSCQAAEQDLATNVARFQLDELRALRTKAVDALPPSAGKGCVISWGLGGDILSLVDDHLNVMVAIKDLICVRANTFHLAKEAFIQEMDKLVGHIETLVQIAKEACK